MERKVIVEIAMTYLPDIGGGETHLRDVVSYLSKYYDTVVITMKPYQNRKERLPFVEKTGRVTVIRLPRPLRSLIYRNNEWKPLASLIYLPLLTIYVFIWSIIHRNEVLAFHLHGLLMSPLCILLKSVIRRRCVISVHFTFRRGGRIADSVVRWSLARADCILALSELEKENLLKFGVPREKVKRSRIGSI
ncbi:glycosyltransferase [Sulfodiicoccus acidiphilus]|uniref:glycosyltransferase n=1 Tax=Sulfodiicoccus acidiphilus TaxID=1670455 RepID=UPI001315ADA2|nr:glycosyltransferase [Sulfodiicoccus acidiphilus]